MPFIMKRIAVTYDLKRQALIREALSNENIDYKINPILLTWSINRAYAEYKIYVKKKDFERAKYIIDNISTHS